MRGPDEAGGRGVEPLLRVRNLRKHFPVGGRGFGRRPDQLKAVDGVSFELYPGETLGLVGESGCGKSTTARALLRLEEPTAGSVVFRDREVTDMGRRELRAFRREAQIVFQDPFSSLNPRMTVGTMLEGVLTVHGLAGARQARRRRVGQLLEKVGLAVEHARRHPHELSGGQRQRVGIARALAVEPELLVLDEPVSSLDVSIQAQVINLLRDLQKEFHLTYLFIAHDLGVVEQVADRVAVMYLGRLVEVAPADLLYRNPVHPYTRALLSALPDTTFQGSDERRRAVLGGDVPSPVDPPAGCPFHPRCPHPAKDAECRTAVPELEDQNGVRRVSCWKTDG